MNGLSSVAVVAVVIAGFIAPPAPQTTYATSSAWTPLDDASTCGGTLTNAPAIVTAKYNETAKFVQKDCASLDIDGLFQRAEIPVGSGYRVIQSSLDFLKREGRPVFGVLNELIYDPDEDLNNLILTFMIKASPEEAFALGNLLTRQIIREGVPNTSSLVVLVDAIGALV